MKLICPLPAPWEKAYQRLAQFAHENHLDLPPRPLVLSLWHLTDDLDKQDRWQHHLQWARENNCEELLSFLPESDFYTVKTPIANPHLPILFAMDNNQKKIRPADQELDNYLKLLERDWKDIVGKKLSRTIIKPLCFSGKKGRCLNVLADGNIDPPWGDWENFNGVGEVKRYQFTVFRAAICKAIAPHIVDHIKFFNSDGRRLDRRCFRLSFKFKGIRK